MKNKVWLLSILFALLLCLGLSSCSGANDTAWSAIGSTTIDVSSVLQPSDDWRSDNTSNIPYSINNTASLPQSTSAGESIAASSVSGNIPDKPLFLNAEMLDCIGHPLSALGDGYGEDYYFHGVGSSTDALVYYNPYICFYINAIISGMDGTYSDPFTSENAIIQSFTLQSEYDPATSTITGQDSLRRLFLTEEVITYELLCQKLGQTPTLVHNASGGYTIINEFELPDWQMLEGGTYGANYVVENRNIAVNFIESEETYIALSVNIS